MDVYESQINDKINRLQEKALRLIYNETVMSFEDLLIKDKMCMIHHQNIQSLAIEIYKTMNNLTGRNNKKYCVQLL